MAGVRGAFLGGCLDMSAGWDVVLSRDYKAMRGFKKFKYLM